MGWLGGLAGGIVGGVAGAFGAKADRSFNKKEGKKQRKWNSREAKKNRQFQKEMRNTSVQARTRDLRKAGFNPLLAVTSGQGAAQPGGATAASYARAQSDEQGRLAAGVADQAARGVSTAIQAKVGNQQISNLKEDERLKMHQGSLAHMKENESTAAASRIRAETDLLKEQLPGAKLEADIDRSSLGRRIRTINRVSGSALGVGSAVGAAAYGGSRALSGLLKGRKMKKVGPSPFTKGKPKGGRGGY